MHIPWYIVYLIETKKKFKKQLFPEIGYIENNSKKANLL